MGMAVGEGGLVMNKNEAIKAVEQDKIQVGRFTEITREANAIQRKIEMVDYVPLETVLSMIDKINESQKVPVPKFVADRIEWCKKYPRFWDLEMALSRLDDEEKLADWAYDENGELIPEKVETFARAWLDGYTVEKEKMYTVEIPNPNSNWKYTFLKKDNRGVIIFRTDDDCWKKDKNNQLTEAEIKQDFYWLWQFAREVE